MQRKDARGSGRHDVEGLVDELYATPPSAFVSRREELAAEAKADGRVEDARLIHAARRPTLAAWAANLLLRSQPAESQRFLELGRALREAYRTLDADGIKELSDQRSSIVSALSGKLPHLPVKPGTGCRMQRSRVSHPPCAPCSPIRTRQTSGPPDAWRAHSPRRQTFRPAPPRQPTQRRSRHERRLRRGGLRGRERRANSPSGAARGRNSSPRPARLSRRPISGFAGSAPNKRTLTHRCNRHATGMPRPASR